MPEKIIFTWSGGKDSAIALHKIQANKQYHILALLTTITDAYDRVSMHGVRTKLLEKQAKSIGLPLEKMPITKDASHKQYKSRMKSILQSYKEEGVSSVAFGDIFLEGIRDYRQKNLDLVGMKALFPIWGSNTGELANQFIASGFKSIITCVDTELLPKEFCGREFNKAFLEDLPEGVDPCGENGEFHSFVYEGPIFQESVAHKIGEKVLRENRFYYCDLLPI